MWVKLCEPIKAIYSYFPSIPSSSSSLSFLSSLSFSISLFLSPPLPQLPSILLLDLSPGFHKISIPKQYHNVQYSTVQYSTVQYSTVQYSTVQYSTVQYSTVQYSTVKVLYSAVQYSTVQYRTVQYNWKVKVTYNLTHYAITLCIRWESWWIKDKSQLSEMNKT